MQILKTFLSIFIFAQSVQAMEPDIHIASCCMIAISNKRLKANLVEANENGYNHGLGTIGLSFPDNVAAKFYEAYSLGKDYKERGCQTKTYFPEPRYVPPMQLQCNTIIEIPEASCEVHCCKTPMNFFWRSAYAKACKHQYDNGYQQGSRHSSIVQEIGFAMAYNHKNKKKN